MEPSGRFDTSVQPRDGRARQYLLRYVTNYRIDTEHMIILNLEAIGPIRRAEMEASHALIERAAERFGCWAPSTT
jgi:hypothetical protein